MLTLIGFFDNIATRCQSPQNMKKLTTALISVYHKEGLEDLVKKLADAGVRIISTGGTHAFITRLGIPAEKVESFTGYPSILGGRVKTLHPKIFGGILARRELAGDLADMSQYDLPSIDLVIVDLYPFEDTVAATCNEEEIIEQIDIGGITLIRAAAKNYHDVLVISSSEQYDSFKQLLEEKQGFTTPDDRRQYALRAFDITSHYDVAIFKWFSGGKQEVFKESIRKSRTLRYGENPHQAGVFHGNLDDLLEQLHGKEISYNNLGDIDAAINLISDFDSAAFAILKHNNACGVALREKLADAWRDALAGDPVSAYGGVLITNREINEETAGEINKLFFEVLVAPAYEKKALELLCSRKNRIILRWKPCQFARRQFKSVLNGVVEQDRDIRIEGKDDFRVVTKKAPGEKEVEDLMFAARVVKHTKSNAIVLAGNRQLYASGTGQTSRVDALKQAIAKAGAFGFSLQGAVMASDAFFPFADSVEIAHKAGITAVVQPGGSVRDQDSIDYCDRVGMSMVFTGYRHFKH